MNIKIPIFPRLDAMATQVGKQIQEARMRRGLSQEEMRCKIGLSKDSITGVENGSTSVALGAYLKVLYFLELENDILLLAKEDKIGRGINSHNISTHKRLRKA